MAILPGYSDKGFSGVFVPMVEMKEGIAPKPVEARIAPDRIVLACKPPEIRPHTGFATT